jgi:hypothetical protein
LELGIIIGGQVYDHLLCHQVLPYSNWEWATGCRSESLLSLRHGLQESLQRPGKVPVELQTDNSSAATHQMGRGEERAFNQEYVSICAHDGLAPRTIGVDCPNENGDVESSNGHLKRRLNQRLLLRGSRDFNSESDYDRFREGVLVQANGRRGEALGRELAAMKALPPILRGRFTNDQFLRHQPINQSNDAVVAELQSFGQLTHGDLVACRKALDGRQGLMLLCCNTSRLRGFFAKTEEPPERVTKRRQRFILRFVDSPGSFHRSSV